MNNTTSMWHPGSEGRQYAAAGSRSTFEAKWNPHNLHSTKPAPVTDDLQLMLDVLAHEERVRWLDAFSTEKNGLPSKRGF